jgi:hypothetical protein
MCPAKVKTVYTVTSSKRTKTVLEKHAVHHEIDKLFRNMFGINEVGNAL